MPIELTDADFLPLSECDFQHWGERSGMPYSELRPLSPDAARRVWQRTVAMAAAAWSDETAGDDSSRFDLRGTDDWDETAVSRWMLGHFTNPDEQVVVCYQPGVAVMVPWGVLCEYWLVLFWTGGCAWSLNEDWVLVHDGDQFVFGRKSG